LPFPKHLDAVRHQAEEVFKREEMLKITRAANGEVVFTVSGRMDAENLDELKKLFVSEASGRRITLDLKELILVDQDAVSFLMRCEADNIQLKNCSAYIRAWIARERGQK
jgi:anti-anti-sigma regulatory factor